MNLSLTILSLSLAVSSRLSAEENVALVDPEIKGFHISQEGVSFYISRPCPDLVKNEYTVSHKATRSIPPTIMIRLNKKDIGPSRDCMKLASSAMPLRFTWAEMDINYSGQVNVTVTNKTYPDAITLKGFK